MSLNEIPDAQQRYADDLILPRGIQLVWTGIFGWYLTGESSSFRVTDRSFGDVQDKRYDNPQGVDDINYWTGDSISKSIEELIEKRGHVNILDVGCGPLNKAAYQIAQRYGSAVTVHAIDLLASRRSMRSNNVARVIGNALALPYAEGSMDMIYSFQVMPHMTEQDRDKCLAAILRVLSPGGQAVLNMLETVAHTNAWVRKYMGDVSTVTRNAFPLSFGFDLTQFPWTYRNGNSVYDFRPITEFRNMAPGWVSLNTGEPTPFVHVTKN